jgi:voltage-gated potassium channel
MRLEVVVYAATDKHGQSFAAGGESILSAITLFASKAMSVRRALWRQLDPTAYERGGLSPVNKVVVFIVAVASLFAILDTEPAIEHWWPELFSYSEIVFTWLFCIEYCIRLWVAGENPRFSGILGRFRYAITPAALIDLVAFLPSLIASNIPNLFLLRIFRLLRILRLARLGRFSLAVRHLSLAVRERGEELILSFMLATIVLVFSAAAMYLLEGDSNPEAFGSIPRALWWSVCTLTTVGYGDVYPHTALGRICSAITAIAGIGLIAMPTGILAAAFSDAFQKTRARSETQHDLNRVA